MKSSIMNRGRIAAFSMSVICAIVVIIIFNILPSIFPSTKQLALILVDNHNGTANLFAVQNFMWIAFFIGLAELWIRILYIREEEKELSAELLPQTPNTLITTAQIGLLRERLRNRTGVLSGIIGRLLDNFTVNQATDRCNTHLTAEVELISNDIDRAYASLRYIVWLLPTLGFVGTVWGIMKALDAAEQKSGSGDLLSAVVDKMSVAFCTTLLALILSCILVFAMQLIQTREESYLNKSHRYCLTYFINRLYDKK